MKVGKVLFSLLLASFAGFVIGLLTAPDKGMDTRKKIRQKADGFLEDEIIGYNRIISNIKIKLDQILQRLSIKPSDNTRNWADTDRKTEIII